MGKATKATKKFEKNHLKSALENRKAIAKVKQRQQIKAKSIHRKTRDNDFYKGTEENNTSGPKLPKGAKPRDANVSAMSVDDFFQSGFEILEGADSQKSTANLGKRKRNGAATEDSDDEEAEDIDVDMTGYSDDEEDENDDDNRQISGSDDDDEDDDEDEGMTQQAMDDLAKKDPEFYQFLRENDPEALDFDDAADLAEVDALSDGEGDDQDNKDEQPKKKRKKDAKAKKDATEKKTQPVKVAEPAVGSELTRDMISHWKKAMQETHSLKAARQVVLAFRSAAHLNSDSAEEDPRQRFQISDPAAFNDIVIVALKQLPLVIQHHLPVKESAAGRAYVQTEGNKFKVLSNLLKTYTASVMHLLSTLTDDKTLKLTISAIEPLLPYLLSFKKLLRALIKTVVRFWAQPASADTTRIASFMVLRRLMVIGDRGIRESVLKETYQGLIQGCRVTNSTTIQGINLMKNSAASLWGLDPAVGYTTAFGFVRQLAIHLRNSIVHNQNDAFRIIYNWQYTHSLDFWSCVLAEHCSSARLAEAGDKDTQLKLLVYPLVQVTLGALRLIPTATYFPLRFHLVRSLLRISRATGSYIPVAPALLEVLNSAEMRKPPKASTQKPLDFAVNYKASKAYQKTRVYQDGLGEQVAELLGEFFGLWATNIAFPELALPIVIQIKRWLKQVGKKTGGNRNAKVANGLVILVRKIEANARFIEEKRGKIEFAPKDRTQVDAFLRDFEWENTPLGAYIAVQRKLKVEKDKMMEQARKDEEAKRKEDEKKAIEEAASEGEDEEEDEDEE
ncbi:Nucleolar complex protein 2 [Ceratocystis platani]|uniref:Nucleolar complex protein 2 n=1 Tax=Ceratocystis fimbriata f. sp. platani TaxID=88771 RepID=A0A0F8B8N1_CERFI|nr:Nucleolar complex protein 2 [Ceratocystis platani]